MSRILNKRPNSRTFHKFPISTHNINCLLNRRQITAINIQEQMFGYLLTAHAKGDKMLSRGEQKFEIPEVLHNE